MNDPHLPSIRSGSGRDPALTVVIVNYNGWPDVARLVESLAGTASVRSGACEVVVVDNASEGPLPAELTAPRPGVRLVLRPENGGFAVGVNAGRAAARGPWLLVLNPDVVVPEGQLDAIAARAGRLPAAATNAPGVVGFGLLNPDGTRQPSVGTFPGLVRSLWEQLIPRSRRKYQAGWRTKPGPVDWVTGACVLMNTRMLDDVGGMDEDFFLYYEEVALCKAARDRGWRVEYDPSIEVFHLRPLQNRAISPKMRLITRHSKLLYFRKHLPRWEFEGLRRVVSTEARVREVWSLVQGRTAEGRAWRAIRAVAHAFGQGVEPRGRDVRTRAESVASEDTAADSIPPQRSGARRGVTAGKRRGAA